jgi:glyoxylate carboligase
VALGGIPVAIIKKSTKKRKYANISNSYAEGEETEDRDIMQKLGLDNTSIDPQKVKDLMNKKYVKPIK